MKREQLGRVAPPFATSCRRALRPARTRHACRLAAVIALTMSTGCRHRPLSTDENTQQASVAESVIGVGWWRVTNWHGQTQDIETFRRVASWACSGKLALLAFAGLDDAGAVKSALGSSWRVVLSPRGGSSNDDLLEVSAGPQFATSNEGISAVWASFRLRHGAESSDVTLLALDAADRPETSASWRGDSRVLEWLGSSVRGVQNYLIVGSFDEFTAARVLAFGGYRHGPPSEALGKGRATTEHGEVADRILVSVREGLTWNGGGDVVPNAVAQDLGILATSEPISEHRLCCVVLYR